MNFVSQEGTLFEKLPRELFCEIIRYHHWVRPIFKDNYALQFEYPPKDYSKKEGSFVPLCPGPSWWGDFPGSARNLAFDPKGHLWVLTSDYLDHDVGYQSRIKIFNTQDNKMIHFDGDDFIGCEGRVDIKFDEKGSLVTLDTEGFRRYASVDGGFPRPGAVEGFFRAEGEAQWGTCGFIFDKKGNVCIADFDGNRILVFDKEGTMLKAFTGHGAPSALEWDMHGNIIAVCGGDGEVKILDPNDGHVIRVLETSNYLLGQRGILVDRNGCIALLNPHNKGKIEFFSPEGEKHRSVKIGRHCSTQMVMDTEGNIFIIASQLGVQKYG